MSRAAGDSHVTKNPNNTGERGASVYIGKKNSEKPAEFQNNHTSEVVFFRFMFFAVFRGSCLATSNEKPECEKNSFFYFYASVNGSIGDAHIDIIIHFRLRLQFPWIIFRQWPRIAASAKSYPGYIQTTFVQHPMTSIKATLQLHNRSYCTVHKEHCVGNDSTEGCIKDRVWMSL